MTEIQLEQLLAKKRLRKENAELPTGSQTNVVRASKEKAGVIGTLLHLEVLIERLPVKAMIDTGAQFTIISRATLHDVCRHLKQQQQELSPLEKPTVRVYGKDGPKKGRELVVTAQVSLLFSLGSKSVSVPVFVQLDSEQPCMLGINAILALAIDVSWSNGSEPTSTVELSVATVSLVE